MTPPRLATPGSAPGFIGNLAIPAELWWAARDPAPLAGMAYPHRADWELLHAEGFRHVVCLTDGTARYLEGEGLAVERVNKVLQGRPHIVDRIKDGDIALIFNTTEGVQSMKDSQSIRGSALYGKVPSFTTASASVAAVKAIDALKHRTLEVRSLQSYYSERDA